MDRCVTRVRLDFGVETLILFLKNVNDVTQVCDMICYDRTYIWNVT